MPQIMVCMTGKIHQRNVTQLNVDMKKYWMSPSSAIKSSCSKVVRVNIFVFRNVTCCNIMQQPKPNQPNPAIAADINNE